MSARAAAGYESRSDLELAAGIARRDSGAVRLVMQRNNQRLFRAAWQILRNREDAEDAVQSAYLKAFAAIRSFAGRSSLSTWLTRIVINNALVHARSAKRRRVVARGERSPDRRRLSRNADARLDVRVSGTGGRARAGQANARRGDQAAPGAVSCGLRPAPDRGARRCRGRRDARHSGGHRQDEASARAAAAPAPAWPRSQRRIVGQFPFDRASCERPAPIPARAGFGAQGTMA